MTDQLTPTLRPEEAFADVVLADEEWLRAEFDAIIAAVWSDPPGQAGPTYEEGVPTH